MIKRTVSLLLSAACLLCLSGCWDHVEISEMLIIAGIGLDLNGDGKTYHATVEFINVEAEGGENITAEIVEGDGATINGAIENAMHMTGGIMFGNHCKVIVVGDSLARSGINGVVEVILRDPDFRKTVDILVAGGSTAKSVLTKKTVKNDIVSYELSKMLSANVKSIENTVSIGMYQLHEALISDCPFFVVPTVYSRKNNGDEVLEADGCAVFTGDRLQGFLDGEQSKLYNIITRGSRNATITLEAAGLFKEPADVKITKSMVTLRPYLLDGALSMRIEIKADATLEKAVMADVDIKNPQTARQVEDGISAQLSAAVTELAEDVRDRYKSDIFEFYREFEDRYREQWPDLKRDWGLHFADVDISVVSEIRVTGSGLIDDYSPRAAASEGANALP